MTSTDLLQHPSTWALRKGQVRRRLREATVELGLADGLDNVSIDDIAAAAGVSRRTFFNYFEAKEDAALTGIMTVSDDAVTAFAGHGSAATLWSDLTVLLTDDLDRADSGPVDLRRCLHLHESTPALKARQFWAYSRFETALRAAVLARITVQGPPPGSAAAGTRGDLSLLADTVSSAVISAVGSGIRRWIDDGCRGPVRPPVEAAFAVLARAFSD